MKYLKHRLSPPAIELHPICHKISICAIGTIPTATKLALANDKLELGYASE
jgi:hypothetical protein